MKEKILSHLKINERMEEALLLQLISSEPINILLIGDPASGKTSILKSMTQLKDKAKYCECNLYSQNFFQSKLIKEVLSETPLLCINRIDRASVQEQHVIEEIIKSGAVVLATANPRLGRFDPYDLIVKQVDLPTSLINCFDLIFSIKEVPNLEKDKQIASLILKEEKINPSIQLKEMLKNHQDSVNPKISEEALEEISNYYVSMRNSKEEGMINIPITPHQLTTLRKLSKAIAKSRFSEMVSKDDAQEAIKIMEYYLNEIVRETGPFNEEEKTLMSVLRNAISSECKKISLENIYSLGLELGLSKEEIDLALNHLKEKGEIFEPQVGFIQVL